MNHIDSEREGVSRLNEFVYRIGPLGSPKVLSSYLVIDSKIAIIDCGPSSVIDELLNVVRKCGISPDEIDHLLLTHIHLDHAGGAAKFLRMCPKSTVMIPEKGFKHLLDPSILNRSSRQILGDRIFDQWGACEPVTRERAISIAPRQEVALGHTVLEYIPAPGHASHHNVINAKPISITFAADSLGIFEESTASIIPTTPPPSFDLDLAISDISMVQNLASRLVCLAHFKEFEPETLVFERIKSTYKIWAKHASELVRKKNLPEYDLNDCEQLFSELVQIFPEYTDLSEDLREQAVRVNCGGMLNYFIKLSRINQ
ncbi:MAG: MBL fold metallo-hydrolase [Thaumarchaeota archaeon]|nr:MBL fold metallo-hydrolase [Nitrososphaerota archaeon]